MPVAIGLSANRTLLIVLVGLTVLALGLVGASLFVPRWCRSNVQNVGFIGLFYTCQDESIQKGLTGRCARIGTDASDQDLGGPMNKGGKSLFASAQALAIASFVFTLLVLLSILSRLHVSVVIFQFVLQIVLLTATVGTMAGACDNVPGVSKPTIDVSMGMAIGALMCVLLAFGAQIYALIRGNVQMESPEPSMTMLY